ncbi:MAG: hypothetical protein WBX00_15010, partial [Isosphaeraceae bacterium]
LHQERRLYFNSPELIQGGTQATPRVKTARISWKSLALARQHPLRQITFGSINHSLFISARSLSVLFWAIA